METYGIMQSGTYYDSIVLMQLQAFLEKEQGVARVAVMMGTDTNKEILKQTDFFPASIENAQNNDLIIVVACEKDIEKSIFVKMEDFLSNKNKESSADYKPKSLDTALQMMPDANLAIISVNSRFAVDLATESLAKNLHVFLYSDNISELDEVKLKQEAAQKGLLVMGPDCGTAIIHNAGFGFANKVRKGNIGIVAASGTGLQVVTSRIHQLGGGISHAIGTGGRDLSQDVGGITTRQALSILNNNDETNIIVLISKPPAPIVAKELLCFAATMSKPVIIAFLGYSESNQNRENLYFVSSLEEAVQYAVEMSDDAVVTKTYYDITHIKSEQKFLRGLFSGGTLAYDAICYLQKDFDALFSNLSFAKISKNTNVLVHSCENTILDMGADEFTQGRLHPMMDQRGRLDRLQQEINDPQTAIILLDLVLGFGSHQNPAPEIAEVIQGKNHIEVVVLIVGTEDDPQKLSVQQEILEEAGAKVFLDTDSCWRYCSYFLHTLNNRKYSETSNNILSQLNVINIGLNSFAESLQAQETKVLDVNWRPPAGGNQKLMDILKRLS